VAGLISAVASRTSTPAKRSIAGPSRSSVVVAANAPRHATTTKKADVVAHPEAHDHVGLLFSEPPGTTGLLFI
jgi:hypothetical protein